MIFGSSSRKILEKLVVIVGPTGVGKSEIAIQLAERLDGEIISADSRCLYIGMDIGTAKPTKEDLARIPHHLVDIAFPDQTKALVDFRDQIPVIISEIYRRGRLPIMVGGTGQYIRSFVEGWTPPAVAPDPFLRNALEKWAEIISAEGLHKRLAIVDPAAASNIDPRNLRRTVRALEVIFTSGRLFSDQRSKSTPVYDHLIIGLTMPRNELYERIDQRIEKMFASGFVEEVQKLLDLAYSPELPSFSAIGYREVVEYLKGEITLEEAKIKMKSKTRTLVRRQANWLKTDDVNIRWFPVLKGTIDEIENLLRYWLNKNS